MMYEDNNPEVPSRIGFCLYYLQTSSNLLLSTVYPPSSAYAVGTGPLFSPTSIEESVDFSVS